MIAKNLKKRISTSLILLILIFLIMNFNWILIFSLLILGVISLLEFFNIINKIIKSKIHQLIFNLLFTLYVFLFTLFFFIFSNYLHLKIILLILLFGCVASDVGGFIVGKFFKGPKLTKISPNKTISGAIGSFIFTYIIITSLVYYYTNTFNYQSIIISFITSLASQSGDLYFSFLKRKAKIKDAGNFFPGHGGVLDRLDSIFFGLPLGFLSIILIY